MQNIYKFSSILTCSVLFFGASGASAQTTQTLSPSELIQYSINFPSITVHDTLPYSAIFSEFDESCSESSIQDAQKQFDEFVSSPSGQTFLVHADTGDIQKRFYTVKKLITDTKRDNSDTSCSRHYFLWLLLRNIQNQIQPEETNTQLLTLSHDSIDAVNGNEKAFMYLADDSIQKHISKLHDEGFLSDTDIVDLDGKIAVHYLNNCGIMAGNYIMTRSSDGSNKRFDQINVNVNLCYADAYLTKLDRYVSQLFIHEMGHYLYYFFDTDSHAFDVICWNDSENICESTDFVSNYAKKMAEEDYAESFAYWYLMVHRNDSVPMHAKREQINARSSRLLRKMDHFEELLH